MTEHERPSTEQLLIQVLSRQLDRRVAVSTDGTEDASAVEEARTELRLAFGPLWHRLDRLELRCTDEGFTWSGASVLTPEEAVSPLLETLVRSGIHTLVLEPGCEDDEIERFVGLVATRASSEEEDLVMLLFRADLQHLEYSVRAGDSPAADAPSDAEGSSPEPGSKGNEASLPPRALKSAVRKDAASRDREGIVELDSFDSTLYFLDDREIEYLRLEIDKQYAQDHTRSVLGLLLDALQLTEDPDIRDEVIEALRGFLPYLLGSGRFTALAYLTTEVRSVIRDVELAPRHQGALTALSRSVSEKGALRQIFLTLEEGRARPSRSGLAALLGGLDHLALQTTLVWSGQLTRPEAKEILRQALEAHFRERPEALNRHLSSDDRAVLRRGLAMAGRLRMPELVEGVSATLAHGDPAIRRQAVDVLATIGGTDAMRGVASVLSDGDSEVRKAAYRAFLGRPYRSVAKVLRKLLRSTEVESLDLSERKLLFSAFGATVGPDGVEELEQLLTGRRIFGAKPSSETRACAVLALGRIDSAAARTALEAAAGYRDPLVRSAAATALRELDA